MDTYTLEKLKGIHALVRRHFVEVDEPEEKWTMPPADYDGTQIIRDDCDGFCLACRKLLKEESIPSRLVYCEIDGVGHLVVEVEGWILDNRQKGVMPNTLLSDYRWLRISGYEAREPWREIINTHD